MQFSDGSLCDQCMKPIPAGFEVRDGRVYLCKACPDCGTSDALVSTDAETWQAKRDMMGFTEPAPCSMQCDVCGTDHHPNLVFVEVTNRCNMNCPICIANVPGMGFDFHPPMEYFERIFAHLATLDPLPRVELFGGEPTMRKDLVDIINLGRRYELRPRVVTNGIRLADEEYCKTLCDARTRFRLALDGRSPEIYRRLCNNLGALAQKKTSPISTASPRSAGVAERELHAQASGSGLPPRRVAQPPAALDTRSPARQILLGQRLVPLEPLAWHTAGYARAFFAAPACVL